MKPLDEAELTERHWFGLVDKSRAKSQYFMLLAHDPTVLGARTRTDKDIFYNTKSGLPRAERELAAAAVSRLNGFIFCASVHARVAIHHLKRADEVNILLEKGIPSPLSGRSGTVVAAAAALTRTSPAFTADTSADLLHFGFDLGEQVDLVLAAGFFNWANRLMLSIGEPTPAAA
ncbi:MAG: peroxidase-related enzyme [Paracoccaceae bacterium]